MPNEKYGARAIIALGGSLPFKGLIGAPLFEAALAALTQERFQIEAASRLWKGPAWPDPNDPMFFNAVAVGRWAGEPEALMDLLLRTELAFGRERGPLNAPRTLDLDLLDLEGRSGGYPSGLQLPHPRIASRAFVLAPLVEAVPDWRHPVTKVTALEMLENLSRAGGVPAEFGPASEGSLKT